MTLRRTTSAALVVAGFLIACGIEAPALASGPNAADGGRKINGVPAQFSRDPRDVGAKAMDNAPAPYDQQPTPDMMAPVRRLANFIKTQDYTYLNGTFANHDVTIIENFAPYVFSGPGGASLWAHNMKDIHLAEHSDLEYSFAPAIDFSRTGSYVYFSLPTRWSGRTSGKPWTEKGGWAFVLVDEDGCWRVQNYGWAVVQE